MKRLILATLLLSSVAFARDGLAQNVPAPKPQPELVTIDIEKDRVPQIQQLGAACLEHTPYACADYILFMRDKLARAQPKATK